MKKVSSLNRLREDNYSKVNVTFSTPPLQSAYQASQSHVIRTSSTSFQNPVTPFIKTRTPVTKHRKTGEIRFINSINTSGISI